MTPKDISSSQNSLREFRKGKRKYNICTRIVIDSAVARGGAGGARAPPVFFPKK